MNYKNWQLTPIEDDSDLKLISDIKEYGWHAIKIYEDESGPGYVFTVGLTYSYNHPEILVMGIKPENAHAILCSMIEEIKNKKTYKKGKIYTDLIQSYPVTFIKVNKEYYKEFLGYDRWFYRSDKFDVLQMIWTDKNSKFPWDKDFDQKFNNYQKILGKR